MTSVDWYRNKDWNDEIELQIYSKLKRTKSQRDQYLVIQAITLSESNPKVALRLVDEYFNSRTDKFDDVRALLAKANAYVSLRDINNAIYSYREILARENEFPNHKTNTYVDYPYFVATQKAKLEYDNAISVFNQHVERLLFPVDFFKWHAAMALINQDSTQASKALDAAKIKKSGFRFHQDIGLVGNAYNDTIEQLFELCS